MPEGVEQTKQPDVLIIGGGVIGLTTAYFLAREGVGVEVVDQGDFGQEASWAGAGILSPGNLQQGARQSSNCAATASPSFPRYRPSCAIEPPSIMAISAAAAWNWPIVPMNKPRTSGEPRGSPSRRSPASASANWNRLSAPSWAPLLTYQTWRR